MGLSMTVTFVELMLFAIIKTHDIKMCCLKYNHLCSMLLLKPATLQH